jgi:hypothetical protein
MDYSSKILRQELKYAINYAEYAYLRSTLATLIKPDDHVDANGEYHVRSLYFDNAADDAFYEKEAGEFERQKYRIRIYNHSAENIRLELKEKFGHSTAKTIRIIDLDTYRRILSNQLLFTDVKDDPFLRAFYLRTRVEQLRPKVIVDYIREPFMWQAGNVRITFDKQLQTVVNSIDIFEKNQVCISAKGYGNLILEIKYDDFLPKFILSRLKLNNHQLLSNSKYTICRALKNALDWKENVI